MSNIDIDTDKLHLFCNDLMIRVYHLLELCTLKAKFQQELFLSIRFQKPRGKIVRNYIKLLYEVKRKYGDL